MPTATRPAEAGSIDITPVLRDYRQWIREQEFDGDEPPPFWGSMPSTVHPHGVDVNIELDEKSGLYAAWVYPNRMNGQSLETDTSRLLAVRPSTDWPG